MSSSWVVVLGLSPKTSPVGPLKISNSFVLLLFHLKSNPRVSPFTAQKAPPYPLPARLSRLAATTKFNKRTDSEKAMNNNLLKVQHHPLHFRIPQTTLPRLPRSTRFFPRLPFQSTPPSFSKTAQCFKISSISKVEPPVYFDEEEREGPGSGSVEFEDLAPDSVVYRRTLRLVECSMFAAVTGLVYFLSNSLAIENYFGCFFSLPIVISSIRWGVACGRKQLVATVMLLFVLSGPVKALNYLLTHGILGFAMGAIWRLGADWSVSIFLCTIVVFSPLCTFFLIRSNRILSSYPELLLLTIFNIIGSSDWSGGLCLDNFILNKRKHTGFDHHKHSCFSVVHFCCHGYQFDSVDELHIFAIWDFGFPQ
ncbi:hypothetical protein DITRI_Ditri12bG0018800 [Diplodiscus trichospermus]